MWAILLVSLLAMSTAEWEETGAPRLVAFVGPYAVPEAEELVKKEWVGLFTRSNRLTPVRLVLGEKTTTANEEPAYELETEPNGAMVALPAGVVSSGPAVAAKVIEPGITKKNRLFPYERKTIDIVLGRRSYVLRAEGFDKTPKQRLILSDGVREQVLFDCEGCDYGPLHIKWAGDLDGDGELDLITNFSWKYSISHVKVWLSSKAAKGELVGLVAAEMTHGC
ncbi:MAG: hypothetical protein ACYC7A_18030 [Thermoanaerobaculia bacterium]